MKKSRISIFIMMLFLFVCLQNAKSLELLSEDFESPSTPTSWSKGTLPDNGNWVGSTEGYAATDIGITDKASGDFSATDPNHQAFAFRKTNQSGITTAEGVLHNLYDGVTITVEFDVVWDEGDAADAIDYNAKLIAFAPGAARNDVRSVPSGSMQIASTSGSGPNDGTFQTITFSVTGDATTHAGYIGYDVGLRFIGSYSSSLIDNVVVTSDIETNPPQISVFSPGDDATGVALDSDLVVTFDEDIVADSGNVIISNVTEGTANVIDINDPQISISSSVLTVNAYSDLKVGDDYVILVGTNAIKDVYITYFAGITNAATWNFTADNSDTVDPVLVSVSPTNDSTGIEPATNLVANFSEPVVTVGGGTITLTNITTGLSTVINLTDAQVTESGSTITINPSANLTSNSVYAVLFDANAVDDTSANSFAGISDTNIWQFRTAGPPVVTLNGGASAIGVGTAILNGMITVGDVADVYFAWGAEDGGTTSTGNWENIISLGSTDENIAFSAGLSGLYYGIEYEYRVFASNSYDSSWSELGTFITDPPGDWTPAQISAVAWYDADAPATITESGGKVSQWNDKSGNGNHALQGVSDDQPTFTSSDSMVNNMPSIGDPSGSGSVGLDTPSISAKNVYIVSYYKDGVDTSFDGYSTLFSGSGANGQYRVMGNQNTSSFITTSRFNDAGTFTNGSSTSSDTVLPMTASILKVKSSALRTQVYALGYNQLSDSRDWQGAYSEWVFTDGSEDADTEDRIEGYLAWKWGIQGSLPGGHAYASSAPGDGRSSISNTVAANVGETTADLEGVLNATSAVFTVYVYYGTNSNTTATAWINDATASNVVVGAYTNITDQSLSVSIDSLIGNTNYYYAMMASNEATNIWALPAKEFNTLLADSDPPVLQTLNPSDDATGVSVTADLTITFDENVVLNDGGTITISNLTENTGTDITIPDGQVIVSSSSNVVINPSFSLDEDDDYAVLIDGSAVEDVFGNAYGGINDATTWNFTLEAVPPTVASMDIVDDQSGGPVYMNDPVVYTITFSEDMDASTVTSNDFENTGTADILIGDISETSPGVFTVSVTPTNTGTVQLQIPSSSVLNDFYGIPLDTTTAILDDTTITVNFIRSVFSDDFETPSAPVAYSQGTTPSAWVKATENYRANYHGITDKAGGDFSAANPNEQAYAFRYSSNAGITSGDGKIGKLFDGVTYVVSFDVVEDGGRADADDIDYDVKLIAFDNGAARNNMSDDEGLVIASTTGSGPSDGSFETITFLVTGDATAHAGYIGNDLGVRFRGSFSTAIIDNVLVRSDMEVTAPQVLTLSPADNAVNVLLDADLVMTFDEPIVAGAGNFVISNLTAGSSTIIPMNDPQVSISTSVLTVNASSDLLPGSNYAILVDTNAIKDAYITYYAGIHDTTTWNFAALADEPTLFRFR